MTEMDCDTTMESVKDDSEEGVQDAVHHLEEKDVGKECIEYEKFDSTMASLKDGSEGEDGNASHNETINETMDGFNDDRRSIFTPCKSVRNKICNVLLDLYALMCFSVFSEMGNYNFIFSPIYFENNWLK